MIDFLTLIIRDLPPAAEVLNVCLVYKMEPSVYSLLVSQALTLVLLFISETLSLIDSPYSGIIHAILLSLKKELIQEKVEEKVEEKTNT